MIVWIKTPKTGGTSMKDIYTKRKLIPHMIICSIPEKKTDFSHLWKQEWNGMYKFTVVRNPFDRMISAWKYLDHTKHRPLKDVLLDLPNKKDNPNAWMHLARTQTDFISDENGFLPYDRIVRFEKLQAGLDKVFVENGLYPVKIPYLNKTNRKRDYRKYYDAETRAIVENLYWMDLKLFGYEF